MRLGDVPTEHIVVPSFAQISDQPYRFMFRLHQQSEAPCELHIVPATSADGKRIRAVTRDNSQAQTSVSAHIDCWHTHEALPSARVEVIVWSDQMPSRYLCTTSTRPLQIEPAVELGGPDVQTTAPASYSQMQADSKIRNRICSPTALAMALSQHPQAPSFENCVEGCLDPITGAYGSWPRAMYTASRSGVLGAVEVVDSINTARRVLAQDQPIVCSIRFAADALTGAPLKQTQGHLVLLHGIRNDMALVHDPAAADHPEVAREYPLDEFARAWLTHRGAAYFFSKPMHESR